MPEYTFELDTTDHGDTLTVGSVVQLAPLQKGLKLRIVSTNEPHAGGGSSIGVDLISGQRPQNASYFKDKQLLFGDDLKFGVKIKNSQ